MLNMGVQLPNFVSVPPLNGRSATPDVRLLPLGKYDDIFNFRTYI